MKCPVCGTEMLNYGISDCMYAQRFITPMYMCNDCRLCAPLPVIERIARIFEQAKEQKCEKKKRSKSGHQCPDVAEKQQKGI